MFWILLSYAEWRTKNFIEINNFCQLIAKIEILNIIKTFAKHKEPQLKEPEYSSLSFSIAQCNFCKYFYMKFST